MESVIYHIKCHLNILQKSGNVSVSNVQSVALIHSLFLVNSYESADLHVHFSKFYAFLSKTEHKQEAEILLSSLNESDKSSLHKERCIVCDSSITATSFLNDSCSNGHEWSRCSTCFECIQSFSYLECMGCNAKVCMKNANRLDDCMICGCKFRLVGLEFIENS
jgi:hypothetical protein